MKPIYFFFREHQVWARVFLFSITFFFIRLADGIISFWAPNQIEQALQNPAAVGAIISVQSIVGFGADVLFPHVLRRRRARTLLFAAIIISAFVSFFLAAATIKPFLALFIVTMIAWGVYYELESFAAYQFMGSAIPVRLRSGAWGITGAFVNVAYAIAPIAAAALLVRGAPAIGMGVLALLAIGFTLVAFFGNGREPLPEPDVKRVGPWEELRRWSVLSNAIWPAIIMSVMLGFIDATFWVTGVLWTETLARQNFLGGLFLTAYQLPSLFIGFMVARWGVYKGKKIMSEKLLIVAGLLLAGLAFGSSVPWQLTLVFLSSLALSFCYPLIEGVYTDIVARMGTEKKDLIGLINSVGNVSYIIWPPLAGMIATFVGERMTFAFVGAFAATVAFALLFVTPKKLRLPQQEIHAWNGHGSHS